MGIPKIVNRILQGLGLFTLLAFFVSVALATTVGEDVSTFTGNITQSSAGLTANFSNVFSSATQPINSNGNVFGTIQAAINDLGGDGWVYVPVGVYNESVVLSDDNVTLFGAGRGTIIDRGISGHAVTVSGDWNIVKDISAKTTAGGGTGNEAFIFDGNYNIADKIYVLESDDIGIFSGSTGIGNEITNYFVNNTDSDCISLNGPTRLTNGWNMNCGRHGIHSQSSADDSVIDGNIIDTVGEDGILIEGASENNTVTGNRITDWTNEAIDDNSGTSVVIGNLGGLNQLQDDLNMGGNDIPNVGTITSTKSTSGAHDPPFMASDGVVYTSYGLVATSYLVRSSVIQGQLVDGMYIVDFLVQPIGSELWRFYEEVDVDSLRVMITPLDDCMIYYSYPSSNRLRFVAMSGCNNQDAKFNFELSARRYDWAEWPSRYDDFGDVSPSWLQDASEYVLGKNINASMRNIWKSDHPSRRVKETMGESE